MKEECFMGINRFYIYNPYANSDVTEFYIGMIARALKQAGCECRYITDLRIPENREAAVVAYAADAALAKKLGYRKVILWAQGISPEESFARHHNPIKYAVLSARERKGIRNADAVIMVSRAMLDHYEKKYRIRLQQKSVLIPCYNTQICPGAFFTAGKYEKNTFTYVGSLAAWQCFEETVRFYRQIEQSVADTRLEVYTPSKEEAVKILGKYNVKNYSVDYVSNEELLERLKKIKYGFVLRKDTPVNRVATPTKLSSYLSSGVIPVFSDCLSDFKANTKNCTYTLPISDFCPEPVIAYCEKPIDANQIYEEYSELFSRYYNPEKHIDKISELINETMLCSKICNYKE